MADNNENKVLNEDTSGFFRGVRCIFNIFFHLNHFIMVE